MVASQKGIISVVKPNQTLKQLPFRFPRWHFYRLKVNRVIVWFIGLILQGHHVLGQCLWGSWEMNDGQWGNIYRDSHCNFHLIKNNNFLLKYFAFICFVMTIHIWGYPDLNAHWLRFKFDELCLQFFWILKLCRLLKSLVSLCCPVCCTSISSP